MPLTWNVTNINQHEIITSMPGDRGKWHPVTESLVFFSMICGFNEISWENVYEVWRRIAIWQRVSGPLLGNDEGDIYLQFADVEDHVGLTTNASTMTKRQFDAKVRRYLNDEAKPSHSKASARTIIADRIHRAEIEEEEKAS